MLMIICSYLSIFLLLVLGIVLTFMGSNATLAFGVIRVGRRVSALSGKCPVHLRALWCGFACKCYCWLVRQ